jgi:DNA polymerase-3 subunit epsilon
MLPSYVLLDLETTGATPLRDRITEIALIKYEGDKEVSRWQTLVNPEVAISSFIQQLTGINNEMVANAPTFKQIAGELLDYLKDTVLCAHNVRFDHGFLKNEFKRIGIDLRQKVLCTVKLSRKLYPQHRSHGLDAIIARHELVCEFRHRAMGDVEMMVGFLQSARQELGNVAVRNAAEALLKGSKSLPSHIDAHLIDDLPETPGVYLFYGDTSLPLYIGKSVNIRERVLSHFSSDHASTKEMRISQEIKHIEWIETAGEFSALLLESKLVKERQPIYNRQLRRERQLCSWRIAEHPAQEPVVTLVQVDEIEPANMGQLFGTFRSKRQATEVLRKIAEQHQLCQKVLGLESGKGACFAHQLKRCQGVCAGKESAELHYLRLRQAMTAHQLKTWPFKGKIGIHETQRFNGKSALHVFEHWVYLGSVEDESALEDIANTKSDLMFDLDTYKLLLKELNKPKVRIIEFESNF